MRGPSVHYLRTRFLRELEDAGFSSRSTIHDIEPGFIRAKSAAGICPRDGLQGLAFVDLLEDIDSAGRATLMLSYTWSYEVADIVDALVCYCQRQGLDMRRTYVWICCLCINQHRVQAAKQQGAVVPFDKFAYEFSSRVSGIGHVLALMGTWRSPKYITRAWCTYEMYMTMVLHCRLDIVLPPSESSDFLTSLKEGCQGLDALWNALEQLDVRRAEASIPSDREQILRQIESGPGFAAVNHQLRTKLHSWFVEVAMEEIQTLRAGGAGSRQAACKAGYQLGKLLSHLGRHSEVAPLMRDLLEDLEAVSGGKDSALVANMLHLLADSLMHLGDFQGARTNFEGASCMHRKAGTLRDLDGADFQRQYADFLSVRGEISDAMKLYDDAVATLEALGATDSYIAFEVLSSRQLVYSSLNRHREAVVDMQNALSTDFAKMRSPCYVYHLVLFAYSLVKMGHAERAQEICRQAHSILVDTGTLETYASVRVLTLRGWVKAEVGDMEGALSDCRAAYQTTKSRAMSETVDGINSMFALARVMHELGDSEGAQSLKQQASQLCSDRGIVPLLRLAPPEFYAEVTQPEARVRTQLPADKWFSTIARFWARPQWCTQPTCTSHHEEVVNMQPAIAA